jgi:phospholipase/carboxylesterase
MKEALHRKGSGESAVILCHGFGANATDLSTLAEVFDPDKRHEWLFPEAPNSLAPLGFPDGRAWYPTSEADLRLAVYGGYFSGLAEKDPPGLTESGKRIRSLVEELGIPWGRIVLGGFSQGTTVALEAALGCPEPPAGIVLFSGAPIARSRWEQELPGLSGTRFFQSHGTEDTILPLVDGRALHKLLTDAGLLGELSVFTGGHSIPEEALLGAREFISQVALR